MKKLLAILCMAAVMVGSVFAAGSVSADEAVIVDKDGNAISGPWIELIPYDNNKADIEGYAIEALAELDNTFTSVLTADAILHDDDNVLTFPIYVKFALPSVKATDKVIVAHMPDQDKVTEWESCEIIKVEDGFVTAKFNSLSPIAIFVKAEAGKQDTPVAPKTGEAPVAAVAGMIAVVAFLGMAVTAKKEN